MPEAITRPARFGTAGAKPARPRLHEDGATGVRWSRVLAVAILFFIAFYTLEADPASLAGQQVADNTEDRIKDEYIDGIEDGNALRKVVIVAYGVIGLAALAGGGDRRWNARRLGAAVFLALVAWTAMSYAWSLDPSLTMRRLIASFLILVGSLGYARWLRPDELVAVALVTFAAFVANSLVIDVAAGGRPWEADYRFAGTLHPNIQAAYCGMLCLAAFAFPPRYAGRWLTRSLLGFGFVMLIFTQSRTSAVALLVGLLMTFMVRLRPEVRWWSAATLLSLIALATIVFSSQGDGARKRLASAALLGRTEGATSLTGRVPLWEELSSYAGRRPLTGYGYESFWTPDNIAAVMKSQDWALQSAHNAYLEVALQLGLVGLVLALATLASGANLLQAAYARTGMAGYAFLYGVMAFAITNSLLESHFAKLKYPTVIALIGLLGVWFFFPREETTGVEAENEPSSDPLAPAAVPR